MAPPIEVLVETEPRDANRDPERTDPTAGCRGSERGGVRDELHGWLAVHAEDTVDSIRIEVGRVREVCDDRPVFGEPLVPALLTVPGSQAL
jgi:hypothetical protein